MYKPLEHEIKEHVENGGKNEVYHTYNNDSGFSHRT